MIIIILLLNWTYRASCYFLISGSSGIPSPYDLVWNSKDFVSS